VNTLNVEREFQFDKRTSFREILEPYALARMCPTLSESEMRLAGLASKEKREQRYGRDDNITGWFPTKECRDHFKHLENITSSYCGDRFFYRFSLFIKSHLEGMLVGHGSDGLDWVLMAWDQNGAILFQPVVNGTGG